MKELIIEKRPEAASGFGLFTFIFIMLAFTEITIGGLATFCKEPASFMFLGTLTAILTTVQPGMIRDGKKHNSRLPQLIEEYLDKELSELDYQALYSCARKHPAIRPMIAACLKDEKLYYREAENLVGQINALLASAAEKPRQRTSSPRQKLGKLVKANPAAINIPDQKLPPSAS